MAITVTNDLSKLHVLFNNVKEVFYKATEIKKADLASALTVDLELPVLGEGVSFNTGETEISEIKLTTGATWTSKSNKGESDISFQVASLAGKINEMMMEKKEEVTSTSDVIFQGATYEGAAYSLAPKKITGSLVMPSEDRQTIIVLPNVEMFASFTAADGDNPAYFNLKVTPLENSEGADIMILNKKA